MTRQNRVLPTGEIVALPFRGLLFGNRGMLHDEAGRVRRPWQVRRWICCVLRFKGRRRPLMRPGRYTELFFPDEAVALAAGHRPCAECRRAEYERFRDAWVAAFGGPRPSADAMDDALHEARLSEDRRSQRRFAARPEDLPDRVFVLGAGQIPALLQSGLLHPNPRGAYGAPEPVRPGAALDVLTPAPTVAVLAAGYVPAVAIAAP